jgi:hypothetical protein
MTRMRQISFMIRVIRVICGQKMLTFWFKYAIELRYT